MRTASYVAISLDELGSIATAFAHQLAVRDRASRRRAYRALTNLLEPLVGSPQEVISAISLGCDSAMRVKLIITFTPKGQQ